LKHCPERGKVGGFESDDVESHDKWLLEKWNETIGKKDIVYVLGDFAFGSSENVKKLLGKLNGQKFLILGNHDKSSEHLEGYFKQITQMKCVTFKKSNYDFLDEDFMVYMCHYPMITWPSKHYGCVECHGHCVDSETDILTHEGWKHYDELSVGEMVWTYNPELNKMEKKPIREVIIYPHYNGTVYSIGKRTSMRMTDEHTVVFFSNKKYKEKKANVFFSTKRYVEIMTSFDTEHLGIDLTDDEIRLYVMLVCDGTIANSNLGRLRFSKQRKIEYTENLLRHMSLPFTKNIIRNGMTYFNFKIPEKIMSLRIKGLDRKIINMTNRQVDILLEAYVNSDGNRNCNGYMIYTSKVSEVNILQELFITHGYYCIASKRVNHGFSKNPSYTLGVYKNKTRLSISPSGHFKEEVKDELFWCIRVDNHNFIARRNGKVFLTGNCHNRLTEYNEESTDLRMDVGIDNGFKFWSLKDVYSHFKEKTNGEKFLHYAMEKKEQREMII